jgi:hypothetical protein
MGDAQLMRFDSHVEGRPAEVKILASRIEWKFDGHHRVTQMLPTAAIASVESQRAGIGKTKIVVLSQGDTVEFRLDKTIAAEVKTILDRVVTQQPAVQAIEPQPVARGSIADDIMGLRWLVDVGVMTEPEFEEERARLLGS